MLETVEFEPQQAGLVIARHPVLRRYEEAAQEGVKLPPRLAGGAQQTWETLVNAYQVSGTSFGATYENSAVLTDVSPGAAIAGQALTIPAGYVVAGNIIRYKACGWYSALAAATLELSLYWGGTAGKALATARKMELPAVTEHAWLMEATTRIIAIGEKGKAITQGLIFGLITPTEAEKVGLQVASLPETKPQTEVEINTAVANILTLGAKWGAASATNKFAVTQWLVEILN